MNMPSKAFVYFSAVYHHYIPVSVLRDVRRRWSWFNHVPFCAVYGAEGKAAESAERRK